MMVERAAAPLPARQPDFATVALQHADRSEIRLRINAVGNATKEYRYSRAAFALGRQYFRQLSVIWLQAWQLIVKIAQRCRQDVRQAIDYALKADGFEKSQRS